MSSGCRRRSWSNYSRSAFQVSTVLARALTLLVASTATLAAGCGSGRDSMVVRERFEAVQAPHRIAGTTSRAGQIVRNDRSFVNAYTVPSEGKPFDFIVPRLATGIRSHAEVTRTLACGR